SIGFNYGLNTGGPAVIIWGWIIGSFFTIMIGLSLAEICSTYPSAGSVYHWAGQLVPIKYTAIASFICGWFNFLGNVAGDAAFSSGFAYIINAAIVLNGERNSTSGELLSDDKAPLNVYKQVGVSIGITAVWSIQNALRVDQQGWLNNLAAFIQIGSTIIIVVTILIMTKYRASAYTVFLTNYNSTGFTFGYVCIIGILSTLFSFSGYEAGAHLAEETRGAGKAAPKGIIATCVIGACVGFAYLLGLLFAIPDVADFITNADNPSFAVQVYELSVPERGALALTILLVINLYFAGMSSTTVTSRIGFAMARDGVFPGSKYLRVIYSRTQTPLATVVLVFIIDTLLLLLQLASSTAFAAILSITTIGYQVSYLIPILFRITVARKTFKLGEFNLGKFGVLIGTISSIWLFITSVFMFFPSTYPVTKDNMNWAIVVVAGVTFIAGLYWLLSARYWFVGPRRATDLPDDKINSSDVLVSRF
ncbi:unnamed protein product, partial [Didymodactylos carnosus]